MRIRTVICMILLALQASAAEYSKRTEAALTALDRSIHYRSRYISARQAGIDSLRDVLASDSTDAETILRIANLYRGFENDSALAYLDRGLHSGVKDMIPRFQWKKAALLPLDGMFEEAERTFALVDSTTLSGADLISYLEAGRQMNRYAADFFVRDPARHAAHMQASLSFQERNLAVMDRDDPWYKYNLAEFYASTGRRPMANLLFRELLDSTDDLILRARTAHHLALLSKADENMDDYIYYLAVSADADVRSATREVLSLQELGSCLEGTGDTERAYRYLSNALRNAVECRAPVRMIDSAHSLPLIEETHMRNINKLQNITYVVLGIFMVMTFGLVALTIALLRRMHRMRRLQARLRKESAAREEYISRFLELASIYMDKLNSFCKLANRKLAAGQADELYRITKSGKFIEEQSSDFYNVFDNMFLHMYPDFPERVNALLRPDAKIELEQPGSLNTDLRILAFIRLGIRESSHIAQLLNYSLNTIYAYRNRLKSRAIDKENFDSDIMKIPSAI